MLLDTSQSNICCRILSNFGYHPLDTVGNIIIIFNWKKGDLFQNDITTLAFLILLSTQPNRSSRIKKTNPPVVMPLASPVPWLPPPPIAWARAAPPPEPAQNRAPTAGSAPLQQLLGAAWSRRWIPTSPPPRSRRYLTRPYPCRRRIPRRRVQ